ncbi:MAG: amidohydrolase family protein [Xanthomonadales bacterium]|nr:amidohydrolase family protein [Xanthomonadales bacterium]
MKKKTNRFVRYLKVLGILLALATGVFFTGVIWPLTTPEAVTAPARLLLTNVAVVDVESGNISSGQSILIENGQIAEVGANIPAEGIAQVNGHGRFAIPGMFDMHAHSIKMAPSLTHPLFVAAGVTAIRDMGGCIGETDAWVACVEDKRRWNEMVQDGRMVGPRYDQVTSLAINGGSEIPDGSDKNLGAASKESARQRVQFDKARGIDFLKTYTLLPREGYFALAEAAQKESMYLAGHLPLSVSALEAVNAGQRSFEHALLFIWECYPGMESLRGSSNVRMLYTNEMRSKMMAEHDPARCAELHQAMVAAEVAFVPTHTTRKLDAYAADEEFTSDERLKFIPAPLRMLWLEDAANMTQRAGDGGAESYREFYEFGIRQTGIAHEAGVSILAGTDAPDSFAFPGTGLHDELEHLAQAGLSPLDSLRATTLAPARFLGLQEKAGVIQAGARADIVLLKANPLADISAVRDVDAVVLAGAYYDRSALDRMLADVERAAGSWSMWPKFVWQILRSPIMKKQFAD